MRAGLSAFYYNHAISVNFFIDNAISSLFFLKCWARLKDVALVQMGLSFRSRIEPEADGTVAVIQMRDLTEDNKLSHRNLITVKMDDLSNRHLVRRREFIFRSRGQITTATILDREIDPAVVGGRFEGPGYKQSCSIGVSVLVRQPSVSPSVFT